MSVTSRHRARTAYFLLILFSLPCVGFSATVHYCNGHLAGLNISIESSCCAAKEATSCSSGSTLKKGCCSKSDSGDKDCCDDKPSFNQLNYDGLSHTVGVVSYDVAVPYVAQHYIDRTKSHNQVIYNPLYPQPPPLSGSELRIKFGSFLC